MPELMRPDGAVIHYELRGVGVPVLALGPGGIAGRIAAWREHPFDAPRTLAERYQVIAMDSRYGGRSRAPLTPFSYEQALADELAVMDAAGVQRVHVVAAELGCAHALRLLYDAPARVLSAVLLEPMGVAETNGIDAYYDLFRETIRVARADGLEGVIAAAIRNPDFAANPGAGPWGQRLHDDPGFRDALRSLGRETYIALVVDFRDGAYPWGQPCLSVNDVALGRIRTPLLVVPGQDSLHPAEVARTICAAIPNARSLPLADRAHGPQIEAAVREFLASPVTEPQA